MTNPILVRIVLTMIFWAAVQGSLRGDGLFQQLPKDGAWAKFRMTSRLFGPSARNSEREGDLRISCVGTVHENERECRWIEIRDENRHLDEFSRGLSSSNTIVSSGASFLTTSWGGSRPCGVWPGILSGIVIDRQGNVIGYNRNVIDSIAKPGIQDEYRGRL
jgi:hypothetical protein